MRLRDPLHHSRRPRILATFVLVGVALLALKFEARAYETCATNSGTTSSGMPAASTIDTVGAYKGLIVFARFSDADLVSVSDGSALSICTGCADGWAATDDYPPSWAGDLIDATTASMKDGSLTHFFHTWSQGDFEFTGDILDTVFTLAGELWTREVRPDQPGYPRYSGPDRSVGRLQ